MSDPMGATARLLMAGEPADRLVAGLDEAARRKLAIAAFPRPSRDARRVLLHLARAVPDALQYIARDSDHAVALMREVDLVMALLIVGSPPEQVEARTVARG